MARYQPGVSGNPAGRPKGTANKSTVAIKTLAQGLLSNPKYLQSLTRRLHSGKLAPALEQMLHFYAWGKPKEILEVEGPTVDHEAVRASLEIKIRQIGERLRAGAAQETHESH